MPACSDGSLPCTHAERFAEVQSVWLSTSCVWQRGEHMHVISLPAPYYGFQSHCAGSNACTHLAWVFQQVLGAEFFLPMIF